MLLGKLWAAAFTEKMSMFIILKISSLEYSHLICALWARYFSWTTPLLWSRINKFSWKHGAYSYAPIISIDSPNLLYSSNNFSTLQKNEFCVFVFVFFFSTWTYKVYLYKKALICKEIPDTQTGLFSLEKKKSRRKSILIKFISLHMKYPIYILVLGVEITVNAKFCSAWVLIKI